MIGVEQSCHCIQQVLVVVQILLVFDQMKLELLFDWFILKVGIAVQVDDELVEEIIRFTSHYVFHFVVDGLLASLIESWRRFDLIAFLVIDVLLVLLDWCFVIKNFYNIFLNSTALAMLWVVSSSFHVVGSCSTGATLFHHFGRFENFLFLDLDSIMMWSAVVSSSSTCSLVASSLLALMDKLLFRLVFWFIFSVDLIAVNDMINFNVSTSSLSWFLSFDSRICSFSIVSDGVEIFVQFLTLLIKHDHLAFVIIIILVVWIVAGNLFEALMSILWFSAIVDSRILSISSSSSHSSSWILLHYLFFDSIDITLAGSTSIDEQMILLVNIHIQVLQLVILEGKLLELLSCLLLSSHAILGFKLILVDLLLQVKNLGLVTSVLRMYFIRFLNVL